MPRKVFISILGASNYAPCVYCCDKFMATPTKFIQRATLEMLDVRNSWSKDDAIIVFTTTGAMSNWVELESEIASLNFPCLHSNVHIPDGKDAKELWKIFQTIFKAIEAGDELYLDVTHGYRFMPMLLLILTNYCRVLKDVTVKKITYGYYEASDRVQDENGYTHIPILDLSSFVTLQDWTFAADDFVKNGNAGRIHDLANKEVQSALKESNYKDQNARKMRDTINSAKGLAESLDYCRGGDIIKGKKSEDLKKNIPELKYFILPPFEPLLDKIAGIAEIFSENHITNMVSAAEICLKNGKVQSAVTLLQEFIITLVCQNADLNIYNKDQREIARKSIIKVSMDHGIGKGEYSRSSDEILEQAIDAICEKGVVSEAISKVYNQLGEIRNDFNHAGMRENSKRAGDIKPAIENLLKDINNIIKP